MKGHLCARSASLWLGGLAAFGIVAAHCLAYVLTSPTPGEMSFLMETTGHRYWGLVVGIALGLTIGGAVGFYVRALRAPRNGLGRLNLFVFAAPRLGALQLVGFALLETSERVLWGAGLAHPLEEPVVIAGLALQVVIAVASAGILSLIAKLAALIAEYFSRFRRARAVIEIGARPMFAPRTLLLVGGSGARGPPVS